MRYNLGRSLSFFIFFEVKLLSNFALSLNRNLCKCQQFVCQLKIYLGLLADQVSGKTGLKNYNNHTEKVKIALPLKKIQVLGPITFGVYISLQEIQNSIEILRPITFEGCSSSQEIQNFIGILELKTFRSYSTSQN